MFWWVMGLYFGVTLMVFRFTHLKDQAKRKATGAFDEGSPPPAVVAFGWPFFLAGFVVWLLVKGGSYVLYPFGGYKTTVEREAAKIRARIAREAAAKEEKEQLMRIAREEGLIHEPENECSDETDRCPPDCRRIAPH